MQHWPYSQNLIENVRYSWIHYLAPPTQSSTRADNFYRSWPAFHTLTEFRMRRGRQGRQEFILLQLLIECPPDPFSQASLCSTWFYTVHCYRFGRDSMSRSILGTFNTWRTGGDCRTLALLICPMRLRRRFSWHQQAWECSIIYQQFKPIPSTSPGLPSDVSLCESSLTRFLSRRDGPTRTT